MWKFFIDMVLIKKRTLITKIHTNTKISNVLIKIDSITTYRVLVYVI